MRSVVRNLWHTIQAGLTRPFRGGGGTPEKDEPPLRAALFSTEQMAQHGVRLASTHELSTQRAPDQLLSRLAANESRLNDTCSQLTAAVVANHRITPAGEWLLDNFYLVEEQIRTARRHLPKGYSRELPSLAAGPSAGLPRVYDIALETIAHGDGRVDPDSLSRFVAAYQSVTPLRLGELWAIPIMLRLALIENLRRVAARISAGRTDRNLAVAWADQLTEIARQDPKNLILVIADMARSNPPMSPPFVSELARRLQGQGPALALPLTWIEQRLAESGLSIEQLVRSGNQQQAADQVSISNSIGSLRFLGTMDWREFVETMSVVEQTLRADPGGGLRRDGFCQPRPLPSCRRGGWRKPAGFPRRRWPVAPSNWRARARRRPVRWRIDRARPCRLLPDRPGPDRAGKRAAGRACRLAAPATPGSAIAVAAVSGRDRAAHSAPGAAACWPPA